MVLLRGCEPRHNGDMIRLLSEDHLRTGRIPGAGGASSREPHARFASHSRALTSQELRPPWHDPRLCRWVALHKTISSVSLWPMEVDSLQTPGAVSGSELLCRCASAPRVGFFGPMQRVDRHFRLSTQT